MHVLNNTTYTNVLVEVFDLTHHGDERLPQCL